RTTIIIAHRLSTVRHADKIIVIDKGMVIEEGNHETLMKRQSNYYNLVKSQAFEEPLETDDYQPQLSELTPDWPSLAILKLNRPEILLILTGAFTSIFNGGLEPTSSILLSEIIGVG
ncbi:unnamed protein product, partial [Rotaria sp. Silwood2]